MGNGFDILGDPLRKLRPGGVALPAFEFTVLHRERWQGKEEFASLEREVAAITPQ
jgi:hypothetical protein